MNCSGKLLSIKAHLRYKFPRYRFELIDDNTLVLINKTNAEDTITLHTYESGGMFGSERKFKLAMIFPGNTPTKIIRFDKGFNYIGDY